MAKKRKITIPRIEDINVTLDTSCLHPILEDNTLLCLHGGKVNLKAKKAKRIKYNNVPIMLHDEIQGASISGCLNPPVAGGPCTKVALVFAYTYSDHKVNNKHSVLQMGLIGMSIKGYPIFAIPKKNKIKFALAKIQASPLAKIKYDRIRWQGIGDKLGAAQKSKEKAKMLLYLENENKKGKVSDKEVHLYKHNGIWPKDTPKPRSPDYILEDGEIDWPNKYGYKIPPKPREITLKKGAKLDRYGDNSGGFVCPFKEKKGVMPYEKRSLPYEDNEAMQKTYKRYEVLEDINMESVDRKVRMSGNEELKKDIKTLKEKNKFHSPKIGKISPCFEQEGGGTQIKLPISIENLMQLGFIKQI
ncbi:TNT domain-containing protein [Campylobacter sp. BCW_6465]|uniref:TNT domain-containing protein n=3 Tax=Campylobacter TaxID=194 RepID=UPI000A6B1812|nr:TNT domain-containing protein [Campylobacter sp. BCW_6465]